MVHLPLLKENAKKKTDSDVFPCISNSGSCSAKHIDPQSDNQWQRDQSEKPIPSTVPEALTRYPHVFIRGNFAISSGYSEGQDTENCLEADIKKEVSSSKIHDILVTTENVSENSNPYFSLNEIVPISDEECKHCPSKHPEILKVKNWQNNLAKRGSPQMHLSKTELSEIKPAHNVSVNNGMTIEHGTDDGGSSLQTKVIEQPVLMTAIPNALMDLEQPESRSCTSADVKVPTSQANENNITEVVPVVNITYGCNKSTQASMHSSPRKSLPSNLSQSFNIFAHKDNDRNKVHCSKTDTALKAKVGVKMSQDFIVLGKSSIQCQTKKIKNSISHSVGFSSEDTGILSKFKKKHPEQKKHFNQSSQKSLKQRLPSISNNSVTSGESNAPSPIRQVHSAKDSMDLKYSDMFKEINTDDKGPGIYEMFGTPVYTREPNRHENLFCRSVHSAPTRRRNSIKPKCNNFSGKASNRKRNSPKKTYPKSHKISFGTKQKKEYLVPKEASELEGSSLAEDNNAIISCERGQIEIEGNIYEDVTQQALISIELPRSAKQNEVLPYSNLSTIEEVSLENTSDAVVNQTRVTNAQEFLWPEIKVHAEYAPFLSCVKDTNEYMDSGESRNIREVETQASSFCFEELKAKQDLCCGDNQESSSGLSFPEAAKSPAQNLPPENISLVNVSPRLTWHSADSISETYPNILSYEKSELTEDLLCFSVTELLSLGGSDNNCTRAGAKNSNVQISNGDAESKEDGAAIERKRRVYCGLTSQGHLIAVKQVPLNIHDQTGNEKEYQKLQEEVEILKNLTHINIVGYLGTSLEDSIVSIFMEFVPGGSISSIIHRFGPLPEIVFCKYAQQIVQGVAYLHENGVIHRDIKGNNIMLMPNGVIKLIDFGCAKRLACVSLTNTHSETLKSVHGTPYWMAPEVINESGYGRKSDIWSIGCTVFEMATGKPPLASMDKIAAMFYIGAHRGLMPSLPRHCSKEATDFVHLCLTRNQFDRPTAVQLLQHSFITRTSQSLK
ncbi:mitogen-activated protein kinase kinase kinase 19 isoform X2 [Anolis carolinensis]|uniref:mitogen-activated protein kinase kinase kinase 19 isoform X2 n=1 Tax=Anolis carolinensis TaxID=28377 RepID=UPI002F2B554A